MRYSIENSSFADEDILEAANWYEDREKGLGLKFIDDLEQLIKYIEHNPLLFCQIKPFVYQAPFKIFPYVLIYNLNGLKVIIIAVFDCYQHPKKLQNRFK